MNKSKKFSADVRARAVRMVREHREEYSSQWAAIESIAPKIGCTSGHCWVGLNEKKLIAASARA